MFVTPTYRPVGDPLMGGVTSNIGNGPPQIGPNKASGLYSQMPPPHVTSQNPHVSQNSPMAPMGHPVPPPQSPHPGYPQMSYGNPSLVSHSGVCDLWFSFLFGFKKDIYFYIK